MNECMMHLLINGNLYEQMDGWIKLTSRWTDWLFMSDWMNRKSIKWLHLWMNEWMNGWIRMCCGSEWRRGKFGSNLNVNVFSYFTDKATHPTNRQEDWEYIIGFCDQINKELEGWVSVIRTGNRKYNSIWCSSIQ